MADFFIPHARDAAQAEGLLEGTRRFCQEQVPWVILPKRVKSIRFTHNGKQYVAEVGQPVRYTQGGRVFLEHVGHDPNPEPENEKLVICLFETTDPFLVCTLNRGVAKGDPILVGRREVEAVELFEEG